MGELPSFPPGQTLPLLAAAHEQATGEIRLDLARIGDRRVIPRMTELARRWRPDPVGAERMYGYAMGICRAADKLADPACCDALDFLASQPGIAGGVVPRGTDPRRVAKGARSKLEDRYAYVEFCTGRALARCGSELGLELLHAYTGDIRGYLARSAADELASLPMQRRSR